MFVVTKTVKNDRNILGKYDELEEALATGERFFKTEKATVQAQGKSADDFVISVIEVAEEQNLKTGKFKLYKSWW